MASDLFTADAGATPKNDSTGSIFLDIIDRAVSWDATRRFGLPTGIDGGTAVPVSAPEQQRVERTPPAPPGAASGQLVSGVSNNTLLIGAAAVLGVAALVWVLK